MVFWFFKKRENSDNAKLLHSKIDNIDKKFHVSFQNVKEDITSMSTWLKEMHQKHNEHDNRFDNYNSRLKDIENKLSILLSESKKETPKQEKIEEEMLEVESSNNEQIISSLTTTDKRLFQIIYQLQKQLGGNSISFKSLASMAYPSKEYAKIRTNVSQYLNTLHKFGLIEKKRVGREAFISLTDLGLSLIKIKIKQEQETRKKKKPKF